MHFLSDVDECSSSPCVTGDCVNDYYRYTCSCPADFTGVNCETQIDDCRPAALCQHGHCVDDVRSYTCSCDVGYTDVNCTTELDECSSNPCVHGRCSDLIGAFVCHCDDGYGGVTCDSQPNARGTCAAFFPWPVATPEHSVCDQAVSLISVT